jgi:hypothetical protein
LGFFLQGGLCWFFPGVAVGEPHAAYSSPVGLPGGLRASAWWHSSPPGFSVFCDVGELCVGWGCGGIEVLPLLHGFSCPVCLQNLRKIFTLRNTCYLLPSSCHLGKPLFVIILTTFHLFHFITVWN